MFKYILLLLLVSIHPLKAELLVYQDQDTKLYGFKDTKGKVVIKPQFDMVLTNEEQSVFCDKNPSTQYIVPVLKEGTFSYIKKDGTIAFDSFYFDNGHDPYEEGLARFVIDGKVGFHNEKGEVIIEARYDFATPFKNGKSLVCNGCWGEYDHTPKFTPARSTPFPRVYDNPTIVKGGKWGAIDKHGHEILKIEFDSRNQIEEMLAPN